MEPKISEGTLIRTVLLFVALINQYLSLKGWSPIPIDDQVISEMISLGFLAVMTIITWWKNNSFTKAAIKADTYMKQLQGK